MKIRKLQIARRLVQFLAVAMLLGVPAVSRYTNYLAARELTGNLKRWEGSLQGKTLAGIDSAFRALPGGEKERVGQIVRDREAVLEYAQALRGGPWSLQVGPISMTDPLAVAESMVARKKASSVLWIGLAIPVVVALLLGRVFCSWLCPMNLFLELTDRVRGVMRFLELPPKDMRFSRWTKYVLLGAGLLLAGWSAVPVLGYVYPPAMIGREAHELVFGIFDRAEKGQFGFWAGGLTGVSLVILGIALFEIFLSRRWWCRYICPGGALYALLGAARLIRVKLKKEACTKCGHCVPVCPVGLNPMADRMGLDCDNCGLCISYCGDNALGYGLWPAKKREGLS